MHVIVSIMNIANNKVCITDAHMRFTNILTHKIYINKWIA